MMMIECVICLMCSAFAGASIPRRKHIYCMFIRWWLCRRNINYVYINIHSHTLLTISHTCHHSKSLFVTCQTCSIACCMFIHSLLYVVEAFC